MSNMNKLLGDIVEASGGVVTNAGNRNGLLKDWLDAAGQVCVPLWQPNGVNQRMDFDAVSLVGGDTLELSFFGGVAVQAYDRFFGSTDFNFGVDTGANGDKFRLTGCSATLNGAPIITEVTAIPTTGLHTLVVTLEASVQVSSVGGLPNNTRYINLPLYNFKVNDGSMHSYPLDDGFANNPTARNLGSGADGAFINNDAGAWGQRCE